MRCTMAQLINTASSRPTEVFGCRYHETWVVTSQLGRRVGGLYQSTEFWGTLMRFASPRKWSAVQFESFPYRAGKCILRYFFLMHESTCYGWALRGRMRAYEGFALTWKGFTRASQWHGRAQGRGENLDGRPMPCSPLLWRRYNPAALRHGNWMTKFSSPLKFPKLSHFVDQHWLILAEGPSRFDEDQAFKL